jgi:hypothetical protein
MIIDQNLRVSGNVLLNTGQPVTVTAVSTNSISLSQIRDMGIGDELGFAISVVGGSVTAAGAATVTFEAITADDGALTTNVIVVGSSGPISKDFLTLATIAPNLGLMAKKAGAPTIPAGPIFVRVNPARLWTAPIAGANGMGLYLGLRYTVATGPLLTGSFQADLVLGNHQGGGHFYPSGFEVV